jgi:hypothetical protein
MFHLAYDELIGKIRVKGFGKSTFKMILRLVIENERLNKVC